MADARPVFEIQHVSKRFDATQALEDVSLTLYPGEVHALIGENGAGKSTLIKIMTGVHPPDTGTLLIDGTPKRIGNSQEAQSLGIAAIYQEPMVFPDLNVAENIFISHRNRGLFVHWGQLYREAEAILAQLDVHLDVRMPARGPIRAEREELGARKCGMAPHFGEAEVVTDERSDLPSGDVHDDRPGTRRVMLGLGAVRKEEGLGRKALEA